MDRSAVGVDDVGITTGQCQVLVEQLEAVGQSQEHADGDGGHYVGDGDLEQGLPAVGTVDLGGFQHVLGNSLQAGDVDDHHVADLLPAHQDDQTPEAPGGVGEDGGIVSGEQTVKDHAPDVTQDDTADQVGHEEDGTEQVGALDLLGQGVGHSEGQNIDEDNGNNSVQGSVAEGVAEALISQRLDVVVDTNPGPLGSGLELGEGQEQTLSKGPDKADGKSRNHGPQEDGGAAPDRPADNITINRCGISSTFHFSFSTPENSVL